MGTYCPAEEMPPQGLANAVWSFATLNLRRGLCGPGAVSFRSLDGRMGPDPGALELRGAF